MGLLCRTHLSATGRGLGRLVRKGLLPILVGILVGQQGRAQENLDPEELPPLPQAPAPAPAQPAAKWRVPTADKAQKLNEQAAKPARVRIGIRLTGFQKVATRNRDGSTDTRYVPLEPLRHTLKARINKVNHFFVGEWHIETQPVKWIRKARRYEVHLHVFRRYGAFGQLEERLGTLPLVGVLEEHDKAENIHVLLGVARQRLRDKFGNPMLDVVAGFQPGVAVKPGPQMSQAEKRPRSIPQPPAEYGGDLLRGRF